MVLRPVADEDRSGDEVFIARRRAGGGAPRRDARRRRARGAARAQVLVRR